MRDENHTGSQDEHGRTFGNIVLLAVFAVLVGGGIWMASLLDDARRAQDCMAQDRRNFAPSELPPRPQ